MSKVEWKLIPADWFSLQSVLYGLLFYTSKLLDSLFKSLSNIYKKQFKNDSLWQQRTNSGFGWTFIQSWTSLPYHLHLSVFTWIATGLVILDPFHQLFIFNINCKAYFLYKVCDFCVFSVSWTYRTFCSTWIYCVLRTRSDCHSCLSCLYPSGYQPPVSFIW